MMAFLYQSGSSSSSTMSAILRGFMVMDLARGAYVILSADRCEEFADGICLAATRSLRSGARQFSAAPATRLTRRKEAGALHALKDRRDPLSGPDAHGRQA